MNSRVITLKFCMFGPTTMGSTNGRGLDEILAAISAQAFPDKSERRAFIKRTQLTR